MCPYSQMSQLYGTDLVAVDTKQPNLNNMTSVVCRLAMSDPDDPHCTLSSAIESLHDTTRPTSVST